MDSVGTLNNEPIINDLLQVLRDNSMQKEARDVQYICNCIDKMSEQIDSAASELENIKKCLKNLKNEVLAEDISNTATTIEKSNVKLQRSVIDIKRFVKSKAADIVENSKLIGKKALFKVTEIVGVRDKFKDISKHLKDTSKGIDEAVERIDSIGYGVREANQLYANAARTLVGKQPVDYSEREKKFSKTEMIKKPFLAEKAIFGSITKILDSAVDKINDLENDIKATQQKEAEAVPEEVVKKDIVTAEAENNVEEIIETDVAKTVEEPDILENENDKMDKASSLYERMVNEQVRDLEFVAEAELVG